MKKAKVILTAITVFAVIGGALAFKAKQNQKVYCTNPNPNVAHPEWCTLEVKPFTTAESIEFVGFSSCLSFSTTTTCPLTSIYVGE